MNNIFQQNMDLINFFYGQAFAVAAMIVFSRPIRRRHIDGVGLATLFAAFASLHACAEWINLPIIHLDVRARTVLGSMLLAGSYLFLFEYGRKFLCSELGHDGGGGKSWSTGILGLLCLFLMAIKSQPQSIWPRYLLALPGGLLAAGGGILSLNAGNSANNPPGIRRLILMNSIAMGTYAILAGAIVPKADFFPAAIINTSSFFQTFHVPIECFRACCGVTIAWGLWQILDIYEADTQAALSRELIRRKVDETAKEAAERIRLLLDSTVEAILGTDLAGRCLFANRACLKMLGLNQLENIQGTEVHSFLHSGANGALCPVKECRIFRVLIEGKEPNAVSDFFQRTDGTVFPVEYWAHPIIEKGENVGTVMTFLDITERKRSEESLRKTQDQLRHAQKMEGIGRLAGGVAHDFNNLLTAIIGYSRFLIECLPSDDSRRSDAEEILKAGERATALTRQLLAFSRRQISSPKVVDCNAVISELCAMLRRTIGEEVNLIFRPGEGLGRIQLDSGNLEQIIMNLAVNAKDAMPEGGRLLIETCNVELDHNFIQTHIDARPGPYVMIAVSDSGVGMTSEVLSHVFEPFFTTKDQGKGTGLGLATVYGIVKQGGGLIYIYSEPGHGTAVKLYFSRVNAPISQATRIVSEQMKAGGNETILLVEDDALVRRFAARVLSESGYDVLVAEGPEEAIRIFERGERPIHLVLTDVVMPQMHGYKMAERISSLKPDIKVLFMSGYTDLSLFRGAVPSDAPFIQKPLTAGSLLHKVKEVLATPSASRGKSLQATPAGSSALDFVAIRNDSVTD